VLRKPKQEVVMRIAALEAPFDEAVTAALSPMARFGPPIALFRTLAHNTALTEASMHGLGGYFLSRRLSVDLRTRELVIDRVSARCGCDYEFGVHVAAFAARAELTGDQVSSLARGGPDDACWTQPRDRTVLALVDELHDTSTVADATWGAASEFFTTGQLLDLLALAGWYHAISYLARAAQVPLEPGAPTLATA
jgi:alkylhydroperoxidase family enzyme